MTIIGIDPGGNGGIAVLNGKNISLTKMPETPRDILAVLMKYRNMDCRVYLEKVGGMPGQGGSSMFNFGRNYGHIEMCLLACGFSVVTVSPQRWQKPFCLGTKSQCATTTIWKNKLKAKAQQLFPKATIYLWGSDAALIAEYGRTIEK